MYSKKLNLIYIHVPKCAGTALIEAVRKIDPSATHGHIPLSEYKHIDAGCTAFTIVRNPWDRAFSCYNYAKMNESFWHRAGSRTQHPDYNLCQKYSFSEVIEILHAQRTTLSSPAWRRNNFKDNWSYQLDFIDDDRAIKIFKYENFKEVEVYLGSHSIHLVPLNLSTGRINYKEFYNDKTRDLIHDIYKRDIEAFGYDYDEST